MDFVVEEHGGIAPEVFERPFFLKHFAAYRFARSIVEGKKILEIGFGDGYGSNYISGFAQEVIAVDLFQKNVDAANAKWNASNLDFQAMDACDLKFEENTFDVVIAFQLVEHIPRQLHPVFFENVKRVLKGTGKFVLTTPNLERLRKNKGAKYEKNPHHDLEFTPAEFRELLTMAFADVEIFGVNYSPRQNFVMMFKKSGIFKHFPDALNPVKRYFDNMPEEDFAVRKDDCSKALDILAVVSE
ncbi:MAG: class I SAM-dependent methyltransferase [Candidatus Tantalella remota]|nr:class I SAM-dependent methyltransferase [Candidatus Tantalella remota]